MRRAVRLSLLAAAVGCVDAARVDDDDASRDGRDRAIVLGVDDAVAVHADGANIPPALAAQMDAVGRAQGLACTGTHVGARRVLTAGHCVTASSLEHCAATSFEWVVRDAAQRRLVGRCVRLLFIAFSSEVDLALLEVDQAPVAAARMEVCRQVAAGEEVSLLGYPERGALRWTGYCPLVADTAQHALPASIGHRCDTKDGSSGSPLFHRASGAVIGVHLGAGGVDFNRALALRAHADDLGFRCAAAPASAASEEHPARDLDALAVDPGAAWRE